MIKDLSHILKESKVGAFIDINSIPISISLMKLREKKKIQIYKYIFGGDDYQIIFTAPINKRTLIKSIAKKMNLKITIIGKIHKGNEKNSIKLDNKPLILTKFKGYSHKF